MSSTKTINGISATDYNREYMRKYREKKRVSYNEYMKLYVRDHPQTKKKTFNEEKILKVMQDYIDYKNSLSKKN